MNRITTTAGPQLRAGDHIEHDRYGHGPVLNVETTNSLWPELRVAFSNERHTWLVPSSSEFILVHRRQRGMQ